VTAAVRSSAPVTAAVRSSAPVTAAVRSSAPVTAGAATSSGPVSGDALAGIRRGAGAQPRSGTVAGRLLRVLSELGLIALAADPLAVTVPQAAGRTELERSPAFRAYSQRLRDGLAFLDEPDAVETLLVPAAA
jgi:hypothetical protein